MLNLARNQTNPLAKYVEARGWAYMYFCFGAIAFFMSGMIAFDLFGPKPDQWPGMRGTLGSIAGILTFAGMICVCVLGPRAWKQWRVIQIIQNQYPKSPWMWRSDWASKEIQTTVKASSDLAGTAACGFLVLNIGIWIMQKTLMKGTIPAGLSGLFTAGFVGVTVFWFYRRSQARRFGGTILRLDAVPVFLGSTLRGQIMVPAVLSTSGANLWVRCQKVIRGARAPSTSLLWEHHSTSTSVVEEASGRSTIRVNIDIPDIKKPTDLASLTGGYGIYWELTAEAAIPGANFYANFELPVFSSSIDLSAAR